MDGGDGGKARLERPAGLIDQPAAGNKQGEVVLTVDPFDPADTIAAAAEGVRLQRLERYTCPLLDLRFKDLNAEPIGEYISFSRCVDLRGRVLGGDNGGGNRQRSAQRNISQLRCQARIGAMVAVGHRQAAADKHVEARQPPILADSDKVKIVGVQIDVVLRRDYHRGFKFARQVAVAQNGLFFRLGDLFTVQPDLGIGIGFRQQML